MIKEKIQTLALRREVQILAVFGILASVGYYIYLKNKKETKKF